VGGYLEAKRIHDLCVEEGVSAFVGGMYETAFAKNANLALAGLSGIDLPCDIVPTERYYLTDVADSMPMLNGVMPVPYDSAGVGVDIDPDVIDSLSVLSHTVNLNSS
jgi:O-succinylbenzoate synthase